MFCSKCGQQCPDNSAFCSSCGSPVQTVQVQAQPQSFQHRVQCEKCGSENVQRLEVVYESGTSFGSSTSSGSSSTKGTGRASGSSYQTEHSGTSYGFSQSNLAASVAPPVKYSVFVTLVTSVFQTFGLSMICLLIGAFVIYAGGGGFGWFFVIIGIIYFLVGCVQTPRDVRNASKLSKEYPEQYKIWQESWICHKCGHVFHHPE